MKTKYFSKLSFAFLVGCGFASVLTSCRFEDEDYFDKPAALRIEQTTDDIKKILVEAPNGWIMQYFTGMDDVEGFNLMARFDASGKVTLAGNHRYLRDGNANKYIERTSLYEMLREDGPVLAFNTWNDVLTPFVDPVSYASAPNVLEKDGEGMHGDHNLVVTSYSKDEILLRGERYGAVVRMFPCPYATWQEYIDATATAKATFATSVIPNYYVTNGTDTLYFKGLRNGVVTYCERINEPLFPSTINCVFTPKGFRLHHQNNVGGTPFQEFTMAQDSTCLVSENDSVRVIACWDTYLLSRTAVWPLDASIFTEEQSLIISKLSDELAKYSANYSYAGIGIGRTTGAQSVYGLVLSFYTNKAKTRTNMAGLSMDFAKKTLGEVVISCPADAIADNNLQVIANRGGAEILHLMHQFAATISGNYHVTPNNYFLPTNATYTSSDGGTTFKLN